jgi:hypothetical protein
MVFLSQSNLQAMDGGIEPESHGTGHVLRPPLMSAGLIQLVTQRRYLSVTVIARAARRRHGGEAFNRALKTSESIHHARACHVRLN